MNRWDKLCDTVGMISRQRDTPSVHQAAGVGGRGRGSGQAVWARQPCRAVRWEGKPLGAQEQGRDSAEFLERSFWMQRPVETREEVGR